jgi:hypothetical protein
MDENGCRTQIARRGYLSRCDRATASDGARIVRQFEICIAVRGEVSNHERRRTKPFTLRYLRANGDKISN